MTIDDLGPFDEVLDVGGNVGEFAEGCRITWPGARITSFEPLPLAVRANRQRSGGRWSVEEVAVSSSAGVRTLHYCTNQHSASTLQRPGTLRRDRFGIVDKFVDVSVSCSTLDELTRNGDTMADGRCLLKVDVEGHELEVLVGAEHVLERVDVVVVEVNQDPRIFVGSPPPALVDEELRRFGLFFAGVLDVQETPAGELVQFDGVWSR